MAERSEHREIGNPLHGRKYGLDLVGGVGERLQIIAVQFDGVLSLYAGDGFRDVVLKVLGEIELDAWKLVLQLPQQLRGKFLLFVGARPFTGRL